MSLILATLLLCAYLRYVQRRTETLAATIAACTALGNVAAQVWLPGASGIGASLLVCGLLIALLTKVRERWDASH